MKVLFFGMLKDIAGRAEDQLDLENNATLGGVFDHYSGQFPRMREMAGSILLARNQEFAGPSTPLADGDEIAFLPPVSGGSVSPREISENGNFFALTWHPIVPRKIADQLLRGEDGAVVTFEGVVRNNTNGRLTHYLDYDCYEPMAIKLMARIGREIAASYAIDRIALVHRLGRILIGETSVAVVVTAAHRRAAFEAALEGIDRLKRVVPIWKKERFADGEVWVEGEWDRNAAVAESMAQSG
ncbi:MAG TPA: molybdenum cofactor biosynthesis protein MoaE [Bryobacteraceae bacterium]|nr:molybdenum cofactor biosynthesis protein MoaE [Bryobacteraceae bacterium]